MGRSRGNADFVKGRWVENKLNFLVFSLWACGSFCWGKLSHLGDCIHRFEESRWRSGRMKQRKGMVGAGSDWGTKQSDEIVIILERIWIKRSTNGLLCYHCLVNNVRFKKRRKEKQIVRERMGGLWWFTSQAGIEVRWLGGIMWWAEWTLKVGVQLSKGYR